MLDDLLKSEPFCELMKKHTKEIVSFLLERGSNFSIITNTPDVSFEPELPLEISKAFKPATMFFLAGYTLESAHMNGEQLFFEAGFGKDNFGSLVCVPLDAILQIVVEEAPLFINLSVPQKKEVKEPKEKGLKRSMEALMSNPKNQKLIKK